MKTLETSFSDRDSRSIYVKNVDYSCSEEQLEALFQKFGSVNKITILRDRISQKPKGYAYIEFEEENSVQKSKELDKTEFLGREIQVQNKRTNLPYKGKSAFKPKFGGLMRGFQRMQRGFPLIQRGITPF